MMLAWDRSDYSISASLFRAAIALLLIVESVMLLPHLQSLYNQDGFVYALDAKWLRTYIEWIFALWILVLILFLFGLGKRYVSLLVFMMFKLLYWLQSPNTDWGDQVLQYSLMFFVMVDSYHWLTPSKSKAKASKQHLSHMGIWMLQAHLIYIYASNGIFKAMQADWLKGNAIGYFLKSSDVMDSYHLASFFGLGQVPVVLNYVVLVYQLFFWVVLLVKPSIKIIIIAIGILMHLSMAFILGLWIFEWAMILLLLMFVKDKEWQKIGLLKKL